LRLATTTMATTTTTTTTVLSTRPTIDSRQAQTPLHDSTVSPRQET